MLHIIMNPPRKRRKTEAMPLKRLMVYLTGYKKECVVAPAFKML